MRYLHFAMCLLFLATSAIASPPSEENAERLLNILLPERLHQERLEELDTLNRRGFAERHGGEMSLTADQRQAVETVVATASQIVRAELAWARIKPDLIRIIQETFNDEEVSSNSGLYATPEINVLPQKLLGVEERIARYFLDRMDAAGPMIDAEIDRRLRELRITQLDTTSDPLAHVKGDWVITTFLFGGGHSGISACGLKHQPASILSHSGGTIEISAACRDGSQYDLKLVRGIDHKTYFFNGV